MLITFLSVILHGIVFFKFMLYLTFFILFLFLPHSVHLISASHKSCLQGMVGSFLRLFIPYKSRYVPDCWPWSFFFLLLVFLILIVRQTKLLGMTRSWQAYALILLIIIRKSLFRRFQVKLKSQKQCSKSLSFWAHLSSHTQEFRDVCYRCLHGG